MPDRSKPDCSNPKNHDEADLCQQRRMAVAAEQTVTLSQIQIAIGVVTLLGLGATVYYTRQTAKAAIEATNVARRALTELEAPIVALKVIEAGLFLRGEGPSEYLMLEEEGVSFCFANYGRTPALLTEQRSELCLCRKGHLPDPIEPPQGGTPYPFGLWVGGGGQSLKSIRKFADYLDDTGQYHLRNAVNDYDLFLFGFIKFTDIFDNRYTVGFCARFEGKEGRFFLDGGNQHNYEDKEPASSPDRAAEAQRTRRPPLPRK
jgi:hypothetical protein